jgi:hypothetical protein
MEKKLSNVGIERQRKILIFKNLIGLYTLVEPLSWGSVTYCSLRLTIHLFLFLDVQEIFLSGFVVAAHITTFPHASAQSLSD